LVFLLVFFLLSLFWYRVLLWSPGGPWTHDPSTSASQVLGIQAGTTMSS
jgi:hypothetical protein